VQPKYLSPRPFVRRGYEYDIFDAPGPAQCRFDMPGAVSSPYHQDLAVVLFHTVHLNQEPVHQCALELLAHIRSIAAQGFDFIREEG
jgi:hypothetical protein